MRQPMLCAYCGTKHTWPDDFPDRTYAQCRACVEWEVAKRDLLPGVPGVFVVLACVFVMLAACYKCLDPACSNVPPIDPGPPPVPIDVRLDAGPG